MRQPSDQHKSDFVLVQQFLSGDSQILDGWMTQFGRRLRLQLIHRGATPAETEELIANLWSDCVASGAEHPSLLEKYKGRVSLRSWLLTVATRRLIDVKRRQRLTAAAPDDLGLEEEGAYCLMERAPAEPEIGREDSLLDLLHRSLRGALDHCDPEDLLMLRLVHLHGITQREVGRMWAWQESKVSRRLSQTMRFIERETLRQVRRSDPWLQLTWQDFLDLCETRQDGFL